MNTLNERALQTKVQSVVAAQSQLHKDVSDKVQADHGKQRATKSRGNLPIFFVGNYVSVARVRHSGSAPELLVTWTGPWRVVVAQRLHVYGVQNIVSGEIRDVHVDRMRSYADVALRITAELTEFFQHALTEGEFEMAVIVDMANVEDRLGFEVEVQWVGFDKKYNMWENLAKIWDTAPQFVKSELRKLRLNRGVRTHLKQ